MTDSVRALTRTIWSALGGSDQTVTATEEVGTGSYASAFAVSDLASASVSVAGLAIAELAGSASGVVPSVKVDRAAASLWFGTSIKPSGWSLPSMWDPIAGDYRAKNGWVRLHTNAPHHRAAALKVLGPHSAKGDVARAVGFWDKGELETAIVNEGGCAAEMMSLEEWAAHPQGLAVALEPLVNVTDAGASPKSDLDPRPDTPLSGLRVLDLTRVLAGPIATRFIAGFGADVLRIDPPSWSEPGIEPEVTLGKRCAGIDLKTREGRDQFESLLAHADVLVHGYRNGALDGLGYCAETRNTIRPGLIDVSLDAYGWTGPWKNRRGFDSLVQMSSGIADAGMRWKTADTPIPLPVQAIDHATGYLMAAAAVRAIRHRRATGRGSLIRVSLARTAKLLTDLRAATESATPLRPESAEYSPGIEANGWGPVHRLKPPVEISGVPVRWRFPGGKLRTSEATWL